MQNKILLEAYIPLQISKKHILGTEVRHEAVTECLQGALSLAAALRSWAAIGQRPGWNMSYGDQRMDFWKSNDFKM